MSGRWLLKYKIALLVDSLLDSTFNLFSCDSLTTPSVFLHKLKDRLMKIVQYLYNYSLSLYPS